MLFYLFWREEKDRRWQAAWIGCTHNLWSPVNKACIIVHLRVASVLVFLYVLLWPKSSEGTSFLGPAYKLLVHLSWISEVSLQSLQSWVESLALWWYIQITGKKLLYYWFEQTKLCLGRQDKLSAHPGWFQHCSNLFWDPDLDTTQLCMCTFCSQFQVVHVHANLFPAYQIQL